MTGELDVASDLFLYWLRETRGLALRRAETTGDLITARDGDTRLSTAVRSLLPAEDAKWEQRRSMLESLIAHDLPARVALWCPAGADLPSEEPDVSEFAAMVLQAALKLGPHERSHVPLPARIFLRKNSDSGGVVKPLIEPARKL